MRFERGVVEQRIAVALLREIDERLVHHGAYAPTGAPLREAQHVGARDEVARRIVGVDEQQRLDRPVGVVTHQVVRRVGEVGILRHVGHHAVGAPAVGVLLEGGVDHAHRTLDGAHEALDELGGAVAHADVGLAQTEVFGSQQRIDAHSRGVFAQQGLEVGFQLLDHALRREVGIDQIAEVEQGGEAPVAAVAALVFEQLVFGVGEEGFGDAQVLHVVDFVPFLSVEGQGLEIAGVDERDDAQHLLVVCEVGAGHGLRTEGLAGVFVAAGG